MEAASRTSVHGDVVKKEMRGESTGDEEGCKPQILHEVGNGRNNLQDDTVKPWSNDLKFDERESTMCKVETTSADADLRASSSAHKEQEHDPLESARAEMGEVIQENERLKMHLDRIMKDYRDLQMQFQDVIQQEAAKKSTSSVETKHESEEHDFVSLSLGRTSSDTKKYENRKICSAKNMDHHHDQEDNEGLALGLEMHSSKEPVGSSTNLSNENSIEEVKDEAGETWPPQKTLKTPRSEEDDISQQNPAKKARVSVRIRCDTPTINDGCQWRKYGQKIAKGNPCPRAYYRCTIAPNCPVRKQVQRCAEDIAILITTYEGTHNHPLPVAATAMASTTSAAASMLLSGSSSSSGSLPISQSANSAISTNISTNINGLNFYLSHDSKSKPFYLPNSSISSSSHSPYPTITLDLTSSSSYSLSRVSPKYSSTNLNFSSVESNTLPISWSNGVLSYGSSSSYNKNQMNSLSFGRQQPQDNQFFQSYLPKEMNVNSSQPSNLLPDTIAAATYKAITSNPSFQSALAAALSSLIGSANGNATVSGTQIRADNKPDGQSLKFAEPPFPVLSSFPSTSNANKCASSFLNKSPSSTDSQPFSLQPSLPFSTSNSKSSSPGDSRDRVL